MTRRIRSPLRARSLLDRRWARYTLAIGLPAAACILQAAGERWLPPGGDEIFLAAVTVSALVGGAMSGLSTLTASAFLRYFFWPPDDSIRALAVYFVPFLGIGIALCWIGGRLRPLRVNLACVLDAMDKAVVITDRKRRVQFMNAIAEVLTGWTEQEATGKDVTELIPLAHDEAKSRIEEAIEEAGEHCTRVFFGSHTLLRTKQGAKVPIEGSNCPIRDSAGRLTGAVMVLQDITRRKQAEWKRELFVKELQQTLGKVKLLSGHLPICAWCKKVREDGGTWRQMEEYFLEHSEIVFTHGFCPDCAAQFMPATEGRERVTPPENHFG